MTSPRLPPIANPDAEVQEILEKTLVGTEKGEALAIFRTLAHNPMVLKRFNVLGGGFMSRGVLPARLRELVILRVAWLSGCDYEWGQHAEIALRNGVTKDEVAWIPRALEADYWSAVERAALKTTDRLMAQEEIDDELWARLSQEFDSAALVELILLIGFYRMTADFLKTMRVPLEDWLEPLPSGS